MQNITTQTKAVRAANEREMYENVLRILERTKKAQPEALCTLMKPELCSCDFESKTLIMEFEAQQWESNPNGMLHGGITTAILDTAMGYLDFGLCGYVVYTVSLMTNYLRPAPLEGTLCVRARADKVGGTMIFNSGEMYLKGEPDKILATASGSYIITDVTK